MKLDKFTDYALRTLVLLALRAPQRVSASEVAAIYRLSEHHLAKVATELARGGFVRSERGRNGGLTLAREPAQIRVGAVVRAMTRNDAVAECFGSEGACLIQPACGLRGPLREAQEAFFATLDGFTLADITRSQRVLASLLAPTARVTSHGDP